MRNRYAKVLLCLIAALLLFQLAACAQSEPKLQTLSEQYPLDCDALTFICKGKAYEFTQSDVISKLCGAVCFDDWQKVKTQTDAGAEPDLLIDLHNGTAFAVILDTSHIRLGTRPNADADAGSWSLENAGGWYIAPQTLTDAIDALTEETKALTPAWNLY